MKILIKNLRRILLVQLFIVGATLSITATNAGAAALACAIPETASEKVKIGSRMIPQENLLCTGL